MTTFHLVLVVLDPFTNQSAWLLETAGRILRTYLGADCRVAWLITGTPDEARAFLGPWAEEILTFTDPERSVVRSLELESLPAIVHLDHGLNVVGSAEGWDPEAWRSVTDQLTEVMSWSRPVVPDLGDPVPFAGTPAVG